MASQRLTNAYTARDAAARKWRGHVQNCPPCHSGNHCTAGGRLFTTYNGACGTVNALRDQEKTPDPNQGALE